MHIQRRLHGGLLAVVRKVAVDETRAFEESETTRLAAEKKAANIREVVVSAGQTKSHGLFGRRKTTSQKTVRYEVRDQMHAYQKVRAALRAPKLHALREIAAPGC